MNKLLFILTLLLFNCFVLAQVPDYLNPEIPVNGRVMDLLERMTLEEKIGQMTQADHAAVSNLEDVKSYFLGSILSGGGSDPASGNSPLNWVDLYDSFQSKALETRLGIPLIYGIDAVHGHSNVVGAVIFPHNIGLGATRNPELVRQASRITAVEIAATGIDWTFAPCIAVPRNEKWGRTYEGFGETSELAVMLGGPAVNGFQNDSLNSPTSVAACSKHYIGDGGTLDGIDQGNTLLSEEELRNIHLPGYEEAIKNDVKTIMASYNSWNGSKLHGNSYLINDLLKNELGFKGFVVSDWAAIDQLPGDYTSDIETSINAGIDMVMVPNNYEVFFNSLKSLVEQNKINIERINDAVSRILTVKFEMGLFEFPLADRSLLTQIGSQEHRDVARQCVRESQVMLKKNDNVLPLSKSNLKILVAGEHADNIGLQCGGWTIEWQGKSGEITEGTTILEGLQRIAPQNEFIYSPDGSFTETDIDMAIAVIGEQPYAEGQGDSDDLTISESQTRMIRSLKKMGLPVITILISGRPMIINPALHNSDVFIAGWLPGTEGDGIAEILFGDYLPTGKLGFTWQKSMEQIPQNFGDQDYDPLFAYGFGITNYQNSEPASSPIFNTAMLTEDGLQIEIEFNKSMNNSGNDQAEFVVSKSNGLQIEIVEFNISNFSNNIISLSLAEEITKDEIIKLSYITGNLASEDDGVLQPFNDMPVINFRSSSTNIGMIPGRIEAEDYSNMFGIQVENTTDYGGGENVGWIDDGDWIEFNCNIQQTGNYFGVFRVASASNGGKLVFLEDNIEKFSLDIPITNGWQNWTNVSEFTNLTEGEKVIRLYAEIGGFNINWFEFSSITDVHNESVSTIFHLKQNYPNPFNPSTTIEYYIAEEGFVELNVYDVLGRNVDALVQRVQNSGNYSINYNANHLTSGIYYYRLRCNNFNENKKFILMK